MEIPFFFLGTPSGHDVEFHLNSWLEVLFQWKQGIDFPRWAALANFGYGEPRFIFYPPASWMLGGLLSAILPWRIVASVYIWLALTLAGISMFVLARRWFSPRDAVFVAVLYAINPYHLVIVYWRSAFAELLASCLLPMLMLLMLRTAERDRRTTIPLSLLLAAAWLTNAPAAVMIHYSFALLVLLFAWQKRSPRILGVGAAAVAIGACLAAFYLLPAIYEQRWVDIAQAVSQGSRPQDNFLFIHTTDPDHDKFNRIISWVAIFEMAAIFAFAWAARTWRESKPALWRSLAVWAMACSLLMFGTTAPLWKILPKLAFMQFPWRWLLCLSMIFAIFVTAGLRNLWSRVAVCVVAILVVVAAWHFVQSPWWDNAADLRELQDNVTDRVGYEGTDEYTPLGAESSAVNKDSLDVAVEGTAHVDIHVTEWGAESKSFTANVSAPTELELRLFSYPAWKAQVNGQAVQLKARPETGQIVVPVQAGMNQVRIKFKPTWDRKLGEWISIVSLLGAITWALATRPRTKSD